MCFGGYELCHSGREVACRHEIGRLNDGPEHTKCREIAERLSGLVDREPWTVEWNTKAGWAAPRELRRSP